MKLRTTVLFSVAWVAAAPSVAEQRISAAIINLAPGNPIAAVCLA